MRGVTTALHTVVVGSINLDTVVQMPRIPMHGETVLARRAWQGVGGKGANQAAVAAACGVPVSFVGAIGADPAGDKVLAHLHSHRIDTSAVSRVPGAETGQAWVWVEDDGENCIAVVPGANHHLSGAHVVNELTRICEAQDAPGIVLCQSGVPARTVDLVAATARVFRWRLVLNLAPVISVSNSTLNSADPLIVNAGEADELARRHRVDHLADPWTALSTILGLSMIVTCGDAGSVLVERSSHLVVEAVPVDSLVDTSDAGDAYIGAFVAGLARRLPTPAAMSLGAAEAARRIQRVGAQG